MKNFSAQLLQGLLGKFFFFSWRRNKRKNVSHRRLENFQKTELKNSILLQLLCKNIQALKDEFEKNNVK